MRNISKTAGRAGLTIWWALRTAQRRGPTGKLDAEEGDGWEGCPLPTQLWVCVSSSSWSGAEPQLADLMKFELENASDDKHFSNL